jgi:hypothetical protein
MLISFFSELPTLTCSLKESTMSLSTLEGLDGSLGTTMLFILDSFTWIPSANSASVYI